MIKVEVLPTPVLLTSSRYHQRISCDFLFVNETKRPFTLSALELSVFDSHEKLVTRRVLNTNGFAPSIRTLPHTSVGAVDRLMVFNPFDTFHPDIDATTLRFTFTFASTPGDLPFLAEVVVKPVPYTTKTVLRLPLQGGMVITDGHDFYSHHRRLDLLHPIARQLGLHTNSARYALDMSPADDSGAFYRAGGDRREQWYGFGAVVCAPGSGTVSALEAAVPDNELDGKRVVQLGALSLTDARTFAGNYLVIDHKNGEYSLLAHLQQHSVSVRQGEQVATGQPVAKLGFSGSTGNEVHLHYELRDTGDVVHAEGLPADFYNFRQVTGARRLEVARGHPDTGDVIETVT